MKQAIILLCGVPGSGKTWVLSQLGDKFAQVHNDDYIGYHRSHLAGMVARTAQGDKPVIVDCPFAERAFKEELEGHGLEVYPFFIVEPPQVVAQRYEAREGKILPASTFSRAASIGARAVEWKAPHGTSAEILKHLQELVVTPIKTYPRA